MTDHERRWSVPPTASGATRYTGISMPRVRFAPSPTGFLHIGSARTYIFNWLYAPPASSGPTLYTGFSSPRFRFAPSPTGFLHIGSPRPYIFNWLYARHTGGTMILRIDDTDVGRNTDASLASIFDGLRWLDLGWDEEYKQSDRLALH